MAQMVVFLFNRLPFYDRAKKISIQNSRILEKLRSLLKSNYLVFIQKIINKIGFWDKKLAFFVVLFLGFLSFKALLGVPFYLSEKSVVVNGYFSSGYESVNTPVDGLTALATGGHDEISGPETNLVILANGYLMPLIFNDPSNNFKKTEFVIYEVQKGDSIVKIASKFNISPNTIIWANDLKNEKIVINQKLKILPISGVSYKIKKDDTIELIAKKFKADKDLIIEFNNLDNKQLAINSEIIIPNGIKEITTLQSKQKTGKLTMTKTHRSSYFHFLSLPNDNLLKRPLLTGRISQGLHARNGIDIAAPCGTPINASAPGLVTVADSIGWNGGMGKYVVLYHNNGSITRYGHLSKVSVKTGDYVPYDKVIGLVGNTGRSTGCHLHFETHGFKNPYVAEYSN